MSRDARGFSIVEVIFSVAVLVTLLGMGVSAAGPRLDNLAVRGAAAPKSPRSMSSTSATSGSDRAGASLFRPSTTRKPVISSSSGAMSRTWLRYSGGTWEMASAVGLERRASQRD